MPGAVASISHSDSRSGSRPGGRTRDGAEEPGGSLDALGSGSRSGGRTRRLRAVAAALAAVCLAACAPSAPASPAGSAAAPADSRGAAASEPRLIRFGLPSLALSYMPMYIADEQGFFAQHGLRAEFMIMESTVAPAAMDRGEVDYAGSGTSSLGYDLQGGDVGEFLRL